MRLHTVIVSPAGPLTPLAEEGAIVGLTMALRRHRAGGDELGEPDRGIHRGLAYLATRDYRSGREVCWVPLPGE
jgi:hypothetical protein